MENYLGLLILGFGGHARSVADVAIAGGIGQLCFIDEYARPNECFAGFEVLTDWPGELPDGWAVMPASGDNSKRQALCQWSIERGWPLATLVAPTATIGFGAVLGAGCFVAQHAHVGPRSHLGQGCIVNTGAVIDHEVAVGEYSHVSIGACVAGRGQVGRRCFLGAGSTVIDGLNIANGVTLGAGACATKSLEVAGVYVGVPARLISRK
ncbi:acetyltransferase [Pseudomonas agarici]|uniref:Acetyltransferase n=1 Tax=Pseudomonas agarici TaxID=46677 RepID=A0A0X1T687_PSEAA|nr:NeuD/PglB/VioB family sugar acetyltransferase [Pseudomonas agarici]AMB87543.1 acetyltransferase [Pseudomonas agarici]NWB90059.1 NeuD/PglB/VioB family sugar acetyltransferase [Pseudomonas agarici]NWC08163.1 NeuD/PglB/VioB family sugar acetyltransferase [Pseudomonas agarici]SEK85132.1 sugar O-acyltransferase, sialic acid O-acetyltransferase NeuD family [Pseudomonas agarici]